MAFWLLGGGGGKERSVFIFRGVREEEGDGVMEGEDPHREKAREGAAPRTGEGQGRVSFGRGVPLCEGKGGGWGSPIPRDERVLPQGPPARRVHGLVRKRLPRTDSSHLFVKRPSGTFIANFRGKKNTTRALGR